MQGEREREGRWEREGRGRGRVEDGTEGEEEGEGERDGDKQGKRERKNISCLTCSFSKRPGLDGAGDSASVSPTASYLML